MRRLGRRGSLAAATVLAWTLVGGWLVADLLSPDASDANTQVASVRSPDVDAQAFGVAEPLTPEEIDRTLADLDPEVNHSAPPTGQMPGDCLVAIQTTRLDLRRSWDGLGERGVEIQAVWPATYGRNGIYPAVSSSYRVNCREFGHGERDDAGPIYFDGYVAHRGGVRFAGADEAVTVRQIRIRPHRDTVEVVVATESSESVVPAFRLLWSEGRRTVTDSGFRISSVPVVVTTEGAEHFNRALKAPIFVAGTVLGEAALSGEVIEQGPRL